MINWREDPVAVGIDGSVEGTAAELAELRRAARRTFPRLATRSDRHRRFGPRRRPHRRYRDRRGRRRCIAGRLQDKVWELRANLTAYDAAYIAAAEALGVTLLTGDQRLAAAPVAAAPS
ncbi:MAG TPA: PIN domain-containing protein [Pseudonocardiaceae bacterium]|jgi:hypothetical protein|nr:PIN domain-containing protein [Pseudonocardiaceae bacterium]